jgi:hypothetical protein
MRKKKNLYEAYQNNAGGYLIGPAYVYIIATNEKAANLLLDIAKKFVFEGLRSDRWFKVDHITGVRGPEEMETDHEDCFLDDEFNLIPIRLLTYTDDPVLGACFEYKDSSLT